MMKETPILDLLPVELIREFCTQLNREADLGRLAATCRALNTIITPVLYARGKDIALYAGAYAGRIETIRRALDAGAEINQYYLSERMSRPCLLRVRRCHCYYFCTDCDDPNLICRIPLFCLDWPSGKDIMPVVNLEDVLLTDTTDPPMTDLAGRTLLQALHIAVVRGNQAAVGYLLQRGADPIGRARRLCGCWEGKNRTFENLESQLQELVGSSSLHGIQVGVPALHLALCRKQPIKMVRLLIDMGADVSKDAAHLNLGGDPYWFCGRSETLYGSSEQVLDRYLYCMTRYQGEDSQYRAPDNIELPNVFLTYCRLLFREAFLCASPGIIPFYNPGFRPLASYPQLVSPEEMRLLVEAIHCPRDTSMHYILCTKLGDRWRTNLFNIGKQLLAKGASFGGAKVMNVLDRESVPVVPMLELALRLRNPLLVDLLVRGFRNVRPRPPILYDLERYMLWKGFQSIELYELDCLLKEFEFHYAVHPTGFDSDRVTTNN